MSIGPARHKSFSRDAFTLIEILVAMAIFSIVIVAIYSTWSGVVKASQSCQNATAEVQRERMAARTMEEALSSAHAFVADVKYYAFVMENGVKPMLSFVAHLPKSYPRSGKFGDFDMRRVTFSVENGLLLLRQNPILMDLDSTEDENPLELAKNVKTFEIEALDPQTGQWSDTWTQTNQMPAMVTVTMTFDTPGVGTSTKITEGFQRVIALPSIMVQSTWQTPSLQATRTRTRTQ